MTAYRVTTPVASYTGEVGGCHFVKGVYEGDVPDGPLAYFTGAGYTVEPLKKLSAAQQKAVDKAAADQADADAKAAQEAADAAAKAEADAKAAEEKAAADAAAANQNGASQ